MGEGNSQDDRPTIEGQFAAWIGSEWREAVWHSKRNRLYRRIRFKCLWCRRWWLKSDWVYEKGSATNLIGTIATLIAGWLAVSIAFGATLWATADKTRVAPGGEIWSKERVVADSAGVLA